MLLGGTDAALSSCGFRLLFCSGGDILLVANSGNRWIGGREKRGRGVV